MDALKPLDYSTLRFLIADDKAFIRTIVQGMLTRLRAKDIVQAASGQQALKLLRKYGKRIDCIVSDWNMHPVGGLELLRAVRSGDIPGLPPTTCFVMLTGHGTESVVKAALDLDVNAYLIKPVSYERLSRAIEAAFTKEVKPKHPSEYQALGDLEIPSSVKAADASLPPWVLWIAKSPRKAQLEDHIQQIRRDAAAQKRAEEDYDVPEVTNTRRLLLGEIQPGAVLAEDVYANDRALLVAAGTRLSASLLSRLKDLTEGGGEEVKFWVGDQVKSSPA